MVGQDGFQKRMKRSAQDFWIGVRPEIERRTRAEILPLESLKENKTIKAFDQVGIDAFYLTKEGNLKGLASRMQYSDFVKKQPCFSFRYALWDSKINSWDYNREYERKLYASNNPHEFNFFPQFHVESFGCKTDRGHIGWSYMAHTKDIMNYARDNIKDENKVRIYEPRVKEKRMVLNVLIAPFSKQNEVHVIFNHLKKK